MLETSRIDSSLSTPFETGGRPAENIALALAFVCRGRDAD